MTYGWAIFLLVLILAALFAFGIFDISSFVGSRASGFAQIGAVGWRVTPAGAFSVMLKNNAGTDIAITQINATLNSAAISNSSAVNIANGEKTGSLAIGSFGSIGGTGSGYMVKVVIAYNDTATGMQYVDSGTLSGKAV